MTISAHAAEIQQGDTVRYLADDHSTKTVEARAIIRDCGCIHVREAGRVVTFRFDYPVEIVR